MTLEQAYREAVYVAALPEGPARLRVGERSEPLDALLRQQGAAAAARITAANPGSTEQRPAAVNAAGNARLAADLDRFGCTCFPCRSEDPEGEWPEEGFLALGLDRVAAERLGRAYGQAGILWIEAGRPVELVML